MQYNDALARKTRVGFLDPYAICQIRHNFPSSWPLDHHQLEEAETLEQKAARREKKHEDFRRHVSAYIRHMTLEWQDKDYIWAPYNFEYVKFIQYF